LLIIFIPIIRSIIVTHLNGLLIFWTDFAEASVGGDVFVASPVIDCSFRDFEGFGLIPGFLELGF
jgi:hypothetical protein